MHVPATTALTAGALTLLQITLAFLVSGARGRFATWIGAGGNPVLERLQRRHANLAENAALFLAGFLILDMSASAPHALPLLCAAFIAARLCHAIGLSFSNTGNLFRLAGGVGTYLIGFVLGAMLIQAGIKPTMF